MAETEMQLVLLLFKLQLQGKEQFVLTEEGSDLIAHVVVLKTKDGRSLIYWPSDRAEVP